MRLVALAVVVLAVAFSVAPTIRTSYRVTFAGAADLAPGRSGPAVVTVAQKVTLSPTPTSTFRTIRHGTTVAFTATARPTPSSRTTLTFQVYRRSSGVWRLVLTKSISSDVGGTARLSVRFATIGDYEIRARASATTRNAASAWTAFVRYHVR